jgi:hypothetical protein
MMLRLFGEARIHIGRDDPDRQRHRSHTCRESPARNRNRCEGPAQRYTQPSPEIAGKIITIRVNSSIQVRLSDSITTNIVTEYLSSDGKGRGSNTAAKVGGGAAAGAIIGALAGGGPGAAIGAASGGALKCDYLRQAD